MRLILSLILLLAAAAHAADPVAGKFWYEQTCARCHGSPPQERQNGTPNITGFSADRIRGALANIPAMVKVNLPEPQILDVEAYLRSPLQYLWAPGIDFTDLWWMPAEAGWGMHLTHRPNARVAGTLYIYDADRKPLWLLMTGVNWVSPLEMRGTLLRSTASGFPPMGFDPASVATAQVGTFSLIFADRESGVLTFDLNGVAYSKSMQRFAF